METHSHYLKAPGQGIGINTFHTLWFGEHELLQVEHKSEFEHYEHLFYRDIRAIYVRKNRKRAFRLGLLSILLLLGLSLCFTGAFNVILGGVFTLVSLIAIISDLRAGPSCDCYAITSLRSYRLHPWSGLHHAKKGTAMLRERVIQSNAVTNSPSANTPS